MKNCLTLAILSASLFTCKTPLQEYNFETIIWAAAWSPDGRYVASGGNSEALTIWSADTWQVTEQHSFPKTITNTAWHPAQPKLAVTLHLTSETSVIIDMENKKKTALVGNRR
jgi:WD40 repeat protein